jgi:hypothetical protein
LTELPAPWFKAYALFLTALLCFIFRMSLKQTYTWVEWLDLLGGILVWDLVFNFFLRSFTHWGVQSRGAIYVMLAVGFVLFLPEYIALYLYGYRRM